MNAALRPALVSTRTEADRSPRLAAAPFLIRDERPRDALAREMLLDRSFGLERFAKTCERLRDGRLPAAGLSVVAADGTTIVGTLRFWHVEAGGRPALLLGPLAVDAKHRSAGIGRALMEHGLARAKALGHGGVILVGDAPYYARFGFSHAPVKDLVLPGPVDPDRFLGLELIAGAFAEARGKVLGTGARDGSRPRETFRLAA